MSDLYYIKDKSGKPVGASEDRGARLGERRIYEAPVFPAGTQMTGEIWSRVPAAQVDRWMWRWDYAPRTKAQLALIDGEGLWIRMTCFERDPVARHVEYGDEVWIDSAMECFFAAEEGGDYINCEMNSAGNRLVGVGADREDRITIDNYYPCPEVRAVVDGDVWYAETFYPAAALNVVFGDFKCAPGARLYGNFFKVGEETGRPHYGVWNAVTAPEPDFHRPECFGEIIFSTGGEQC